MKLRRVFLIDLLGSQHRARILTNVISFIGKPSRNDRFGTLVQPYFEALYQAARRMTLTANDAEDLVQDVCIKAFERLDELEGIEFPRAWLLRVMYNEFIDGQRRAARSAVAAASTGADSVEPDRIAAQSGEPEELVDRDQHVMQVLRAMRCLKADQCALVAMHDVEGVSVKELSELTGMSAGTIKSQLHRTRKKLGRLLSSEAMSQPYLKVIGGKQ